MSNFIANTQQKQLKTRQSISIRKQVVEALSAKSAISLPTKQIEAQEIWYLCA
jgi:hypothetical protein